MLLTDWNIEEAKEVWREEALEEGRGEGRGEGQREGREEIIKLLRSGKSPEEIIKEYGGN
jgi:flagellar biosynthesis/type III secretory pathway protein FliH